MRAVLALAPALALLVAGCLAPTSETIDPASLPGAAPVDWFVKAVPFGEGHDHADVAHHAALSTPNFEVVGWDPLVTDHYGTTLTGMGCGGVGDTEDGRRIALVHSISTDVAFVLADVTDPAHPQKLGEFYLPNVVVWDATITPDGRYGVVAADLMLFGDGPVQTPVGPVPPGAAEVAARGAWVQPMFRNACTGEETAAGPAQYLPLPGVVLVDITDPTAPVLADWVAQPVIGPHSVTAHDVDGATWVTSSVTNLVHQASYYTFFEVQGGRLVPISVIQAPGHPLPTGASFGGVFGMLNGHIDVVVHKHPIDGTWYAWLANWGEGVSVYDMTDPKLPRLVATWKDGDAGSLHNTLPLNDVRDGKHYTIVGQEVGEPEELPSGWVYILDTTDPANPVEVSRWTLPVKPDWDGGLQFSTHYVEVVANTMFVTNYHGGMWAVDITDMADPQTIGIFVPDRPSPMPFAEGHYGPGVEDVVAGPDGLLTVWDNAGGIYQLRFDPANPAPPAPAWGSG